MNLATKNRIKTSIGVAALVSVAVIMCTCSSKKPAPERNCVDTNNQMIVCPSNIQIVQENISCFDGDSREFEIKKGTRFKEGEPMGSGGVKTNAKAVSPGFYSVELTIAEGIKGQVRTQECPQNKGR